MAQMGMQALIFCNFLQQEGERRESNVRIQKQPSGILAAQLLSLLSVRLTVMLCFTALSAKTVEFVFFSAYQKTCF